MVKDKVTKDDLLKFAVGDQKVFTMPSWEAARSAQSYANQMKNFRDSYGWKFRTIISDAMEGTMQRTVTITRIN
jgi:hypothetical protein